MMGTLALAAPLALAALWPAAARAPEPPAAPAGESFQVDPLHSTVLFRIKHLGVSYAWGRFNDVSGSFVLDPDHPAKSHVAIEIAAASIDTASAERDKVLKGPQFFDVERYPLITFESTAVKAATTRRYAVTGDLTLHGTTRSITITAEHVGTRDAGARFGYRSGFEATFTVKRSDHGMTGMLGAGGFPLGDEVRVTVSLEGRGRKTG